MITLRKLRLLPPDTRLRKIVRMLDGFVYYRSVPDSRYLSGLFNLIQEILPRGVPAASTAMTSGENHERSLRIIDNLRYELRSLLNIAIGDWDLQAPSGYGTDDGSQHVVARPAGSHSVSVYMESIRSPFNAGSIIRSAVALGVSRIGMSPDCPQSNHPRLLRTARGAEQAVSIQRFAIDALADDWKPLLALEVGGHDVNLFDFPDVGTLLVGSEELGLSGQALAAAQTRISVLMTGPKRSMNVGVACGIALNAWHAKTKGKRP